jgi:hypothetical protein
VAGVCQPHPNPLGERTYIDGLRPSVSAPFDKSKGLLRQSLARLTDIVKRVKMGLSRKAVLQMASIKEQRAKLQEKIAQLQAKEKALAQKDKLQERKARTKRLIEVGAVVESVVGHPIEKDKLENFKTWLTRALQKDKPVNPTSTTEEKKEVNHTHDVSRTTQNAQTNLQGSERQSQ